MIYTRNKKMSDIKIEVDAPDNLLKTIEKGNLGKVKQLIENGADLQVKNEDKQTALYIAAKNNQFAILKYLIEQGANIQAKEKDNWSILHRAVESNHLSMVRYLIEKGADIFAKNNEKETPFDRAKNKDYIEIVNYFLDGESLLESAEKGDLTKIKSLVELKGLYLETKNSGKQTALYTAAKNNHFLIVKYLVEQGAEINAREKDGWSILHRAVATNNLSMVQYLVENGANLHIKTNYAKETPLEMAKNDKKDPQIIAYLVSAVLQLQEQLDNQFLKTAEKGDLERVKQLLKEGANISAKNNVQQSALYVAVRGNQFAIVKYLVEQGAEINAREKDGWSILHRAVATNNLSIVQYLVENGADLDVKTNYAKETPLEMAKKDKKDQEMIQYLINVNFLNAVEKKNIDEIQKFLNQGAQLEAKTECQWTALHHAARGNDSKVITFLINQGANTKAKDWEGKTPLDIAIKFSQKEIIDLLSVK
jgi:ankyrin repeat protein